MGLCLSNISRLLLLNSFTKDEDPYVCDLPALIPGQGSRSTEGLLFSAPKWGLIQTFMQSAAGPSFMNPSRHIGNVIPSFPTLSLSLAVCVRKKKRIERTHHLEK